MVFLDDVTSDAIFFNVVLMRYELRNTAAKLGVIKYFQAVAKTPTE